MTKQPSGTATRAGAPHNGTGGDPVFAVNTSRGFALQFGTTK